MTHDQRIEWVPIYSLSHPVDEPVDYVPVPAPGVSLSEAIEAMRERKEAARFTYDGTQDDPGDEHQERA